MPANARVALHNHYLSGRGLYRHHRRHTYTSVLPETAHRAAQATADMVIKAARSAPGSRLGGTIVPHVPAAVTASGYCQM